MFCLRKIVPYSCHSPVDRFATVSRNCLGTPQVFSPFMLLPTPSQRRLPAAHLHYSLPCFFCSLFGRYFSLIPPVPVIIAFYIVWHPWPVYIPIVVWQSIRAVACAQCIKKKGSGVASHRTLPTHFQFPLLASA
jgi:hypothetical protein